MQYYYEKALTTKKIRYVSCYTLKPNDAFTLKNRGVTKQMLGDY